MADIYVDCDIGSDTGTGTTGDPYGDLQFAINSTTIGANGDSFWCSGSEVLGATLTYTGTYGTPTYNKRMILRSWNGVDATTAGSCDISGAGTYSIMAAAKAIVFYDMELHNCGSAAIVTGFAGYSSGLINCVLHNTSGNGASGINGGGNVAFAIGCYLYDIGGIGLSTIGYVTDNYLTNGTKSFSTAINSSTGYPSRIERNIISLTGASNGISTYLQSSPINNSLFMTSRSGSPKGIEVIGNGVSVLNNVVEGFTTGIDLTTSYRIDAYGGNHCYNNTTNYSGGTYADIDLGDNEDLSGSTPFAKSGADTFANRFTYFEPADVGNMRGGAHPFGCRRDKGAVQHADPAGGGLTQRQTLITNIGTY